MTAVMSSQDIRSYNLQPFVRRELEQEGANGVKS